MSSAGSVTNLLTRLAAGDQAAAQGLWERYSGRLVALARARLSSAPRRAADEEDAVLSAFDAFCRGAEQGRFTRLADRDDLWQVLVMLTARKAARLARNESRLKRGAGRVLNEDDLADAEGEEAGLAGVVGREPTPEFAAQVAEECQRLLDRLGDVQLRAVALSKLEGYGNDEIAVQLGCVPRTVERKLRAIRSIWTQESSPAS